MLGNTHVRISYLMPAVSNLASTVLCVHIFCFNMKQCELKLGNIIIIYRDQQLQLTTVTYICTYPKTIVSMSDTELKQEAMYVYVCIYVVRSDTGWILKI